MAQDHNIITPQTRIQQLLDQDQEGVIAALTKLNRNFAKLKNPVLRKLFARRVTISDACRIAGCDVQTFLNTLQQIGFRTSAVEATAKPDEKPLAQQEPKMDMNLEAKVIEFDARPYLEQDKDPLREIMALVRMLKKGERLKLVNSFEPIPLISLLAEQGFLHHTETVADQLIYTWFEKTGNQAVAALHEVPEATEQARFQQALQRYAPEKINHIDVRHLEMPQPMQVIMAAVETLDNSRALYVHHKKVPVFLLPELEKRDLDYLIQRRTSSEIDLLIYKNECQ